MEKIWQISLNKKLIENSWKPVKPLATVLSNIQMAIQFSSFYNHMALNQKIYRSQFISKRKIGLKSFSKI